MLDLTSLQKSVVSLKEALEIAVFDQKTNPTNPKMSRTIRAGVIQNFEFTYELCWKFIQRWLKEHHLREEAEMPRTRKDLFRAAAQKGLIQDPLPWFEYSEARNLTSHAYDPDKAQTVFEAALRFAKDAESLLRALEKYND